MTTHQATSEGLKIRGLTKSFGSNQVLKGIDLEIGQGEFVALMGPNGAGKSTLIKILAGVYQATKGEISLGGERVTSLERRQDVGFIHQDLGLVDGLSIMENLRLGETPLRLIGPILNQRAERLAAERALATTGLELPVTTLVGDLAPGEKTLVAASRLFGRGASFVVVDEATSTLPPADARRVVSSLRDASAQGATVIMVTHKLSEILDAAKRVVVILDGNLATDAPIEGLDRQALVQMLLQHETTRAEREAGTVAVSPQPAVSPSNGRHRESMLAGGTSLTQTPSSAGEVLLELSGACGGKAGPIDLQLRAGEVIGVTGNTGGGLHDVAFLACGSIRPTEGTVKCATKDTKVALVPPHRESQGGFGSLDIRENLTISSLSRWRLPVRLLALRREIRETDEMIERLSVKPGRGDVEFGVLSGGNKQKVIFGRALLRNPEVYLLCEPTRGVDVGTRSEIYRLIREMRDKGAAVLVVSSDSEDLFAVCDRVGVITEGRVSPLRNISEMTPEELEKMV